MPIQFNCKPYYIIIIIITLQNKALRLMTFSGHRVSSGPLYTQLRILKFRQQVELKNTLFVNDSWNKLTPKPLQTMFILSNNYHEHGLRNQLRLVQTNVRTTRFGLNSIKAKCIKAWNKFTNNGFISIDTWPMSNSLLKNRLKSHYFDIT